MTHKKLIGCLQDPLKYLVKGLICYSRLFLEDRVKFFFFFGQSLRRTHAERTSQKAFSGSPNDKWEMNKVHLQTSILCGGCGVSYPRGVGASTTNHGMPVLRIRCTFRHHFVRKDVGCPNPEGLGASTTIQWYASSLDNVHI